MYVYILRFLANDNSVTDNNERIPMRMFAMEKTHQLENVKLQRFLVNSWSATFVKYYLLAIHFLCSSFKTHPIFASCHKSPTHVCNCIQTLLTNVLMRDAMYFHLLTPYLHAKRLDISNWSVQCIVIKHLLCCTLHFFHTDIFHFVEFLFNVVANQLSFSRFFDNPTDGFSFGLNWFWYEEIRALLNTFKLLKFLLKNFQGSLVWNSQKWVLLVPIYTKCFERRLKNEEMNKILGKDKKMQTKYEANGCAPRLIQP